MGFRLAIRDGRYVQNMRVQGRVTVGRASSNEVRLTSNGVSRKHAVLRQEGASVVVTDLHSKHGLLVDGKRVERALVEVGTDIVLGGARITVLEIEPEPELDAEQAEQAEQDTVTVEGDEVGVPQEAVPALAQAQAQVEPESAFSTGVKRPWGRDRRPRTWHSTLESVSTPEAPPAPESTPKPNPRPNPKSMAASAPAPAPAKSEEDRRLAAASAAFAFPVSPPSKPIPQLVSSRGGLRQQLAASPRLDVFRHFVRRSPWIAGALIAHLALMVVLSFVNFGGGTAYEERSGVITLEDETAPLELDDVDEAIDDETEDTLDDEPEPEVELLPEELPPEPEPEIPEDAFAPVTEADLVPEPLAFESSGTIGLASSTPLGDAFDKDGAHGANSNAAGTLTGSPFGRAQIGGLRKRASAANVLVVKGTYDSCEDVLHLLEVRHGWMTRENLSVHGVPSHVKAVFFNCARDGLTGRAVLNLREFVARGGYLFTTDWGVENVLESAFPDYVQPLRHNGRKVMTKDEVIGFYIGDRHPLLRGMPSSNETFRMWLEDSTLPMHLPNPERVQVLMKSTQLHARYGSPYVTVTFEYERGRVVHSVGHLFQKEGNLRGTVAMQRLLVNFLHQALKR